MASALALGAVIYLGAAALAQPPAAATPATPAATTPPAAPAPDADAHKVHVKYAGHLSTEGDIWHFTGGVILVHDDMTLTADLCDFNNKAQTAVATGHLKITDPDSTITGDQVQADFNQKLAHIVGNVTIITQRKKPDKPDTTGGVAEAREKKTTITCPQIDYLYADDKKQATVTGPVKAVQDDKTVYADAASYDGVADTATLTGNVRLVTTGGSEFRCPAVTISLKDDSMSADNLTGVAVEEEKPAPAATPATPPASAPPPPTQHQ
jgi:lipopolysaccharide assembly outer membrane protein LptD (OstA)